MNVKEAKATSRLLRALAGDTDLDPVTAAAVIETLSFQAGAALEVSRVLPPASLQVAVETAISSGRLGCRCLNVVPSLVNRATFRTSFPTWYLAGGFLFAVMTVLVGLGLSTGQGWLLLIGVTSGAAAVVATRKATHAALQLFQEIGDRVSGQSPDCRVRSTGSFRPVTRIKTWTR